MSVFLLLFAIGTARGQQSQGNSNQNQINTDFDLSGTYFIDQAALELASEAPPIEDYIDAGEYVLGPYDVLSVYGSGILQFTYRGLVVNALGDVAIPSLGLVSVRSLTLREASEKIVSEFKDKLKNTQVSVSIDRPRPVIVHVGGDIPNPGRYVLPAGTRYDFLVTGVQVENQVKIPLVPQQELNPRLNQPSSVSGLNMNRIEDFAKQQSNKLNLSDIYQKLSGRYNLRNIRITGKNDRNIRADLHGYLLSGSKSSNPYVRDGDQVVIPKLNENYPKISISGAVNTPVRVPYKPGDTISGLIDIAGGLRYDADSSKVHILYSDQERPEIIRPQEFRNVTLKPNASVIVPFSPASSVTSVWVFGEVARPGIYFIDDSTGTVRDVLQQAGGTTPQALLNGAYLIRDLAEHRDVPPPDDINPMLLTRASDQFLEGFDYLDLERTLGINRVPLNLSNESVLASTTISDGDRIYVPRDQHSVTLMGQVHAPGLYSYSSQKRVGDYISDAGGLTLAADEDRIFVIKAGSKTWYKPENTTLESGDIIFVDRQLLESIATGRNFEIQKENLKNRRIGLVLSGISVVASLITTVVAIRRN